MSTALLEIERQIAELEEKKKELLAAQREETLLKTRDTIRLFGFNAKELGLGSPSAHGQAQAKLPKKKHETLYYRDPASGEVWIGNIQRPGRKPNWVRALVESKEIDSCTFTSPPPPLTDPRQIGLPLPEGQHREGPLPEGQPKEPEAVS